MSSRVVFPDRNTASTLLKVRAPSGANGSASVTSRGSAASSSTSIRPAGSSPPVATASADLAAPAQNPLLNPRRMVRRRYRSRPIDPSRISRS